MRAETVGKFEWPARALFGLLLAATALAAIFAGGRVFAGLVAILAFLCAREWHRMVGGARYAVVVVTTTLAFCGAMVCTLFAFPPLWAVGLLLLGGAVTAICAKVSGASALWNGAGTLYIGIPAFALAALRVEAPHGALAIVVVFLAVWVADTGALAGGSLLGGPKLVPHLSPNKTWSGLISGTVLPVLAVAAFIRLHDGKVWQAALLGLALALAGHAGDLFESWVKRRVGRKNSGGLIPGHGGVLDRLDSTLFAAPLAAILVFVFGLDPLCGGHP